MYGLACKRFQRIDDSAPVSMSHPPFPSSRATIDDVARRAGVSTATVSRALRGHPNVTEPTRRRVRDAAEALRYVANPNASRLASGRSGTVGALAPILTSWYTSQILAGVEDVLAEDHFDLLIGTATSTVRARVLGGDAAFRQRVDGLLLVDVFCTETGARRLVEQGMPTVVLGERLHSVTSISVDNRRGATLAAEHLCALGHHRIALVSGQADPMIDASVPAQRRDGFRDALARRGRELPAHYCVDGGFTIDGGRDAAHQLLALPEPPTAVFCMSDEMAFGVLQAAGERGVGVPDRLSVVGFDDHDVGGAFGLTTVRQPVRSMGRTAAHLLLAQTRGDEPPSYHEAPVDLVERASTGPAPRHSA